VTPEPAQPEAPRFYRVLFIGNSLTEVNDLPHVFLHLVTGAGDSAEVAAVVRGGFALVDHAAGLSDAVQVIRSRPWDYVVLQQGPSTLPISRDTLIVGTRLLDQFIRAAGGRTAEFMVWPAKDNLGAFDAVRLSYQAAAQAVDGLFLPAGEAWRAAWSVDPSLPLYGPDGFHPSELGTFLAALVILEAITQRDARALPAQCYCTGASDQRPGGNHPPAPANRPRDRRTIRRPSVSHSSAIRARQQALFRFRPSIVDDREKGG
jgi:hypothetical protein